MTTEESKKYSKIYYQQHKDEYRKRSRKSYIKNREKIIQKGKTPQKRKYMKEYYKKNKKKFDEVSKKNYQKNREKIIKKSKIWHNKNIERSRMNHNIWSKNKRETDIHFKIRGNISNAVWAKLVKCRGSIKDGKIAECLPYTIEELKQHLEKHFTRGMSWENYGKWHIDHKIPDSSFKYKSTKDLEFKKCWALENLQPMWGIDNLIKGKKIIIK